MLTISWITELDEKEKEELKHLWMEGWTEIADVHPKDSQGKFLFNGTCNVYCTKRKD